MIVLRGAEAFPLDLTLWGRQSFFGFGQSAEIEIVLHDADRKRVDVKKEDGSKNKLLLYYDGEAVSGKVCALLQRGGLV